MAFTPETRVFLLNVPLENNYKNQIYFSSVAAQTQYMSSKTIKSYYNVTYQRKDNVIRVPEHIDNLWNVNYVMYNNRNFSNKWFYAFITKMEYVNDGRTDIYIETDVWQTWFNQVTLKESFVEREHILDEDDTIGANVLEEGLQLGEYICNKHTTAEYGGSDLAIVIGATATPDKENVAGGLYNNIYSGLKYYVFPATANGATAVNTFIEQYASNGKSDAIICMFMAPTELAPLRDDHIIAQTNTVDTEWINLDGEDESTVNRIIDITTVKIDGYTPKNNKLFSYPFRYCLASNNNGGAVIYKYEDFYTKNENNEKTMKAASFRIEGCLSPGCSVRMVPLNYKGEERYDEEGLNLGKYPCLNWNSDVFTNWLTQNGVNIGLSIAGSVMSGVVGAATGNAIGVASGVLGVANTLGEVYKESMVPPQSQGNINCGDIITASDKNDFHFYDMTIKKQYAELIDKYFEMYGYKVNTVKVPNISGRPKWNYVKTIDSNIEGNIPQDDLNKIRSMFDNGITFWKNASEIENYSLDNHTR